MKHNGDYAFLMILIFLSGHIFSLNITGLITQHFEYNASLDKLVMSILFAVLFAFVAKNKR